MNYRKRQEWFHNHEQIIAPVFRRVMAMVLDFAVLFIIYYLVANIINWMGFEIKKIDVKSFKDIDLEANNMSEHNLKIFKISLGLIPILYFTLSTYFTNGLTIGKKIMGIRIISMYHHRIALWHCLERSLGYVASTLEAGIGFIQVLWNTNRMALHDRIAETVVIRVKSEKQNKKYPQKKTSKP